MGLAPAIAGATRPSQAITWLDGHGALVDLTGATITGKMKNKSSSQVSSIVGLLTVTDGPNGVFVWTYDLTDVAVAGAYDVQFTASYGTAPSPERNVIANWSVGEAL